MPRARSERGAILPDRRDHADRRWWPPPRSPSTSACSGWPGATCRRSPTPWRWTWRGCSTAGTRARCSRAATVGRASRRPLPRAPTATTTAPWASRRPSSATLVRARRRRRAGLRRRPRRCPLPAGDVPDAVLVTAQHRRRLRLRRRGRRRRPDRARHRRALRLLPARLLRRGRRPRRTRPTPARRASTRCSRTHFQVEGLGYHGLADSSVSLDGLAAGLGVAYAGRAAGARGDPARRPVLGHRRRARAGGRQRHRRGRSCGPSPPAPSPSSTRRWTSRTC